ncbi:MAG TPA: alpha/beta fold hydrolase, partial [Ktedonobacterales bacterium]
MTQIISPSANVDYSSADEPVLQERVASVLGYRMAYVTGGEGEPLILIHGLGLASSSWNGVLPALARRFRVFAVDMLGCGRS